MFTNGRKTIGFFICRAVDDFQRRVCEGVKQKAGELGYNVAVFSTFGDFLQNHDSALGEKSILNLPDYENLDGVILALDTFDINGMREEITDVIKKRCKCPVVSIRVMTEDFYNILVDDQVSMDSMIRHFIDEHDCKDICFMSGPKGFPDGDLRLENFKRVMDEKGLTYTDNEILYGDFWKNMGPKACDKFIDQRGKMPDAILCANDYMAISLCHELLERGYEVPRDVLVCGYDGVAETKLCAPGLTTVRVPFYEMGQEAVNTIVKVARGETVEHTQGTPTEDNYSESCGCVSQDWSESLHNRKKSYEQHEKLLQYSTTMTFMSIDLEKIKSINELINKLGRYAFAIPNIEKLAVCIFDDLDERGEGYNYDEPYSDYFRVTLMLRDNNTFTPAQDKFSKTELLPNGLAEDKPECFYFLPVHYQEKCFGYTAISVQLEGGYDRVFQMWMVNLANAVEDVFVRRRMSELIDELEDMYVKDVLTGLLNRRGFEKFAGRMYEAALSCQAKLFIMELDMDGLKSINDNYGHSEGDFAICEIANGLKAASIFGEICARTGGDEYYIAGMCKDESEVAKFIQRYERYISKINSSGEKPYAINASYGYVIATPDDSTSMEQMMNESDHKMYSMKMGKKRLSNRDNINVRDTK